jgi:hypothetical protein
VALEKGYKGFRRGVPQVGKREKESLQGKQYSALYGDVFEEVSQRNVGKFRCMCLYRMISSGGG